MPQSPYISYFFPSSGGFDGGEVEKIPGFDFVDWLKNTVSENDYSSVCEAKYLLTM